MNRAVPGKVEKKTWSILHNIGYEIKLTFLDEVCNNKKIITCVVSVSVVLFREAACIQRPISQCSLMHLKGVLCVAFVKVQICICSHITKSWQSDSR